MSWIFRSPPILVFRAPSLNHLFDGNGDRIRHYGRFVGNMKVISQQHAQCVRARIEAYFGRGAAVTEVNMVLIRRNRESEIGDIRINEQVVMTRIWLAIACLYNAHAFDAEFDTERACNSVAISWAYKKHAGAIGGCRSRHRGWRSSINRF